MSLWTSRMTANPVDATHPSTSSDKYAIDPWCGRVRLTRMSCARTVMRARLGASLVGVSTYAASPVFGFTLLISMYRNVGALCVAGVHVWLENVAIVPNGWAGIGLSIF